MGGRVTLGSQGTRSAALRAAVSPSEDVTGLIRQVAEAHAPEGGYGDTFWNAETKTVYWVSADWVSNDEHDAAWEAFLAIDGVENVDGDAEAYGPEGDEWVQVWPEPSGDLAVLRLVELASSPLPELPRDDEWMVAAALAKAQEPMTAFIRLRPEEDGVLHVRQATPQDFARWRDHQWEGS